MQRLSDPHPTACPKCKAKGKVEQLISAPAAHFKGSGWYATDYAKKPATPPGKSTDTKTEVKAETSTDKKSETKTETKKSESKSSAAKKE